MKGFTILLVVMGHLFIPHTLLGTNYPCNTIIYSFHMPLFFFLSGYLMELNNNIAQKGISFFVQKKIYSLVVPFLFWALVVPIFLKNTYSRDLFVRLNFLDNRSYWFLPTLFIFMLLYLCKYLILKKINSTHERNVKIDYLISIAIVSAIAIMGIAVQEYTIVVYGIYLAMFFFGDAFYKYDELRLFLIQKSVFGICAALLCLLWKFFPLEANHIAWRSMLNLISYFITAFASAIVFYNLFTKFLLPPFIKHYFSEMGKMSLVIYLIPIILLNESFVFPEWMTYTLINISVLTLGILQTIISYVIGRIVYEIPYLRFAMFGKR